MSDSEPSLPRLRLLWSFVRPHRRTLIWGLVLALIGSAMELATPMVTKWILDSLAESLSLTGPVIALVGLLALGASVSAWQWILLGTMGERIVLATRQGLVRRIFAATLPGVSRKSPGELVTRVTSDTTLLSEASSAGIVGIVNGTVMLAGTLVLMGVLDWVLLLTTVVTVGGFSALFMVLMPGIAKSQAEAQEHVGRFGGALESAVRAVKTIKVSRAERRQGDHINASAATSATYAIKALRRQAIAMTLSWSGVQTAIIVILAVGAWRVSAEAMQVSTLIAFLLYAFGLMGPITELSQNITAMQSGVAAAGRIQELSNMESEVRVPESTPVSGGDPVLRMRGVTAAYGPDREPALRDVDVTIPARGHVAIVGPSGAGKTTMFSLLLRFLEPRRGELRLHGTSYRELSPEHIREHIAYVEQETPTVDGTIRDNLTLTHPDAADEELWAALRAVRLTEMVEELDDGLDSRISSSAVSGGQRQRLALARAIIRTPDILLLDEATAQVDGITEAAVADVIQGHAARGAVVTIAHRLSTVVDADSIIVLQDGRIRAQGGHDELLATDELYRELVAALRISTAATV